MNLAHATMAYDDHQSNNSPEVICSFIVCVTVCGVKNKRLPESDIIGHGRPRAMKLEVELERLPFEASQDKLAELTVFLVTFPESRHAIRTQAPCVQMSRPTRQVRENYENGIKISPELISLHR